MKIWIRIYKMLDLRRNKYDVEWMKIIKYWLWLDQQRFSDLEISNFKTILIDESINHQSNFIKFWILHLNLIISSIY
jgi:hypothetical protein